MAHLSAKVGLEVAESIVIRVGFKEVSDFGLVFDSSLSITGGETGAGGVFGPRPTLCVYTLSSSSPQTSIDGATMKSIKP